MGCREFRVDLCVVLYDMMSLLVPNMGSSTVMNRGYLSLLNLYCNEQKLSTFFNILGSREVPYLLYQPAQQRYNELNRGYPTHHWQGNTSQPHRRAHTHTHTHTQKHGISHTPETTAQTAHPCTLHWPSQAMQGTSMYASGHGGQTGAISVGTAARQMRE